MNESELKSKIEGFQHKLKESALGINYVKPEFKRRFLEISKEEFGNDHGCALVGLIKYYDGLCASGHEEFDGKIDVLSGEVNKLRSEFESLLTKVDKKENNPEGYIRSADGSRLIKKR